MLKLGMAVNGRTRLGKSLEGAGGRPYTGNVNLYSVTSLGLDQLIELGQSPSPNAQWAISDTLASVVQAISASIARIDRQFISEVVTISEQAPNLQALLPGWDFFNGPDLTITSWANLDTYSVNFGPELGLPDFVRVPYAEVDGLNIVLPRRRTSIPEIIEVVVMLRKDDMEELERNAMWRYWTQALKLE
jgi:trichothecene 3-O-acetyltransferase